DGCGLPEDRQALFAHPLQPLEAAPVDLGIFASRRDHVVQHGTLNVAGEPLQECEVSFMWPAACVIWMKPSSRSFRTRARLRMSSSDIVSVTIGEPSKSACTESGPSRWIEKPQRPASMPSSSN